MEVQALEDRLRLLERHVRAEDVVDQRRPDVDAHGLLRTRVDVGPIPVDLAAGKLGDQRRGAARACQRQLRRQRSLEARGRLGAQAKRARRLPDAGAAERGRLEEDVRRRLGHRRLFSADHAREGDRPLRVGDHEHVGRQVTLDAVQPKQPLLVPRPTHLDRRPPELREVERVQRLRVLEQDIVGDVHDVVDRPHAGRPKAALHPVRARPDPDARDHAADVAAAQLGVDDADLDQVAARRVGRARERGHEVALHRAVEPGAELARDAEVAHAVRAVGGDLGFHDRLAWDHRRQRLPRRSAVEDQDAGVVVT